MLRKNETSISFSKPFKIHCQICKNDGHEALLCPYTTCVYCKSRNHITHNCDSVDNKMELICNFCNKERHTINICKYKNNIYIYIYIYCTVSHQIRLTLHDVVASVT